MSEFDITYRPERTRPGAVLAVLAILLGIVALAFALGGLVSSPGVTTYTRDQVEQSDPNDDTLEWEWNVDRVVACAPVLAGATTEPDDVEEYLRDRRNRDDVVDEDTLVIGNEDDAAAISRHCDRARAERTGEAILLGLPGVLLLAGGVAGRAALRRT